MDFSEGQAGERGAVPEPETPFGPVLQPVWLRFQNKKQYSREASCISKAAAIKVKRTKNDHLLYEEFNWMSPRENLLSSRSV